MLPSSSYLDTQYEYCEKIANEVFKYGILMKKNVKTNYEHQRKLKNAYQELAKTFYLTNAMSGYKLLEHLVKFCLELICMKVRENVYQGEYGVLSTCPNWVQAFDKPLGLMQIVYKQFGKSTKSKLATCLFSYELLAAIKRAIDNSDYEFRPVLLLKRKTVRSHSLSLGLPLGKIYNLWKKMYKVSVLKLDYLLEAGDITNNVQKSLQLTKIEKNILDLGLLYDAKVRVVNKTSFLIDEKLNAMILLYKLMAAAKESYPLVKQNGARTGADTIYQIYSENVGNNDENLIYYENFHSQNFHSQNIETVEMWALVYLEYLRRGLDASFVLLQKRWYEMKSYTRRLLHPSVTRKNRVPHLLLIAMTKRFPYIITDELMSWFELGKNGQIYTDSDIAALPDEWKNIRLNVKEKVNVNDILEELCEDSQEDIQVIDTEVDAIDVVNDSDSDVNNYSEIDDSNHLINDDTIMPNVSTTQESISEPHSVSTLAQKLGNTDKNIKTTVIIEDDFDIDLELQMYKMKRNNSASTNIASGNELSAVKEPIQNMDTEVERKSLDVIELSSGDEKNNESDYEPEAFIIDKKLFLLPKVVLTPVEKTSLWRKFSRDVIQCGSVNTQKMSDVNEIDMNPSINRLNMATSQVEPIVTQSNNKKSSPNTKTVQKNKASEDKDIRKKLQNKRKFLMRYLKLSKTSYSKEFWSERNINLLEQCKLVSVTLNKVTRVAKKVELSDIDEIRRINKTILTAQVAPMTHTHQNERTDNNSIEKIQQNKVDEENAKEKEINNSASNSETNLVFVNEEIKNNMFKKIVVKKYTSNPINKIINKKPSTVYEIEWLNNNIPKHICKLLDVLVNRDCKLPMRNRKPNNRKRNGKKEGEENSTEDLAFNSIDEWQRQKNFTRKYFHLKPVLDVNNIDDKKDEHNNEQNQNLTKPKQYDSDDNILVIDEGIKIENEAVSKVTKPLKDIAGMSIKKEINEINNGESEISNGISIDIEIFGTHKVKTEINNELNEVNNGISIDSEMFGTHKDKAEINNELSEVNNVLSIDSGMIETYKVKAEINNELSEVNNEIDNGMIETHKIKIEINDEIPINNEIFVNNENIKTNNNITEVNSDVSMDTGISYNNINNEIINTDLYMTKDKNLDLIIISSDDDDDVKPNINDVTKFNENAIKSNNNGNSVPQFIKILPKSLQNLTVDVNNHNVINMLSKVAYNIKSKTQDVQSIVPSKRHSPLLQSIGTVKNQNKIKNDTSVHQQPVNSPSTTYYLIKVPSEVTPSNSFPMPVIQSVKSLSSEENVVITKTNQTRPPIVYNDLLKNSESPESLRSLLTNTNIINDLSLKRVFPIKLDRLEKNKKKQRNTNQSLLTTDKKETI